MRELTREEIIARLYAQGAIVNDDGDFIHELGHPHKGCTIVGNVRDLRYAILDDEERM